MRFHTQTAGVSLTAQQPMNNIARVAIQALAGVLGGTQSLHTDSYDEALALPTEEAVRIALRTQQIIAYESGVAQTVDPLGGSYFVERLTLDMEKGAFDYFEKLDAMGGMVAAIEKGYPQKEIAEASYQFQRASEAKEKVTVGANEFVVDEPSPNILYIGEEVAVAQTKKLNALRARRSNEEVQRRLEALKKAAAQEPKAGANGQISPVNTMPFIIDAVKAYATVGEICDALRGPAAVPRPGSGPGPRAATRCRRLPAPPTAAGKRPGRGPAPGAARRPGPPRAPARRRAARTRRPGSAPRTIRDCPARSVAATSPSPLQGVTHT